MDACNENSSGHLGIAWCVYELERSLLVSYMWKSVKKKIKNNNNNNNNNKNKRKKERKKEKKRGGDNNGHKEPVQ